MKSVIIILLSLHAASSTIDLQQLSEKLHTQIQTLKDTATTNIQEIKDSIDLDKLKQLDVLGILPIVQTKGKLLQLKHQAKKNKIRLYVRTIEGLKSKVVGSLPWPAMRRTEYIYSD